MEFVANCMSMLTLAKEDFVDLTYDNDSIIVSWRGNKIDTVVAGECAKEFIYRKTLRGVVRDIKDNQMTLQIIHWADLHRHSGYSLLDGAIHVKDMVAKTEYAGALTDHGVMFGELDYYKKMKSAGKKPILGFEAYSESIDGKKERHHLLLLAKNEVGFKNLIKLTSMAYENFYVKPHVSYEMLRNYSEGVIATSACIGGEIPQLLMNRNQEGAKRVILELVSIFGKDDFYLEIQRHGIEGEQFVNTQLIAIAKELDLKVIATSDSHYTNKEDNYTHEILLCLQTGKTMSDTTHMKFDGSGYHLQTWEEMEQLFSDIPEALDNTLEIAEKCNVVLDLSQRYMPEFKVPDGFTEDSYFEHLCKEGFERRFKGTAQYDDPIYRDRLNYEIGVVQQMGFPGYFLIVWDFVKFAKDNGIMVGPGRGSCVGSLASFCLGITELDPIPFGLLFERFLNPERISMPDIDMDFQDERRDEVINYVRMKYGDEAVSKIVTFGTMGAKAVVRDVARVLDYPYSMGDKIAKTIPVAPHMTLKKAMDESVEFLNLYNTDEDVKKIVDIAMKLEGLPRHCSQHACGIIIAPSAVRNYIPELILENTDGIKERTIQWNMVEAEEAGLLKMDFLGLRTMNVIGHTLEQVNEKRIANGKAPIEFLDIPLNDKKVYEYISTGDTFGVFQLESPGMRSFMKDLFQDASEIDEKDSIQLFERLIAGVSLYRPGPMDSIPQYIENMRNPEYIQYDVPQLKGILETTYGVIVYQEQVMEIVRTLAGYSMGRSDLVRRAMGKKKKEVMEKEKEYFINGKIKEDGSIDVPGCVRNGVPKEIAEKIWDLMAKFAEYAFNKSHAGGYAVISNATAWLKYYYPTEFMTSIFNSFITNADKLKGYLSVCKSMNIKILPPDVNKSKQKFKAEKDGIRFGLMGIKNMGKVSENIISERNERNEFDGFQDFAERMAKYFKVDKRVLEALVYSGAVDCFPGTRRAKLSVLGQILDTASQSKADFLSGQMSLFDISTDFAEAKEIKIPEMEEFPKKLKLEKEKEFAGFYVTEHPLDDYTDYFIKENVYEIGFLQQDDSDELGEDEELLVSRSSFNGQTIKIAGIIKDLQLLYTKRDQKPLYVFSIEDKTAEMKAVIFADRIPLNQDKLVEGKVVIVQGQIKEDDRGIQIIARNMFDIEAIAKSEKPKSVWIKALKQEQFKELNDIILQHQGELPVYIRYNNKNFKANLNIDLNFSSFSKLQEAFGNFVKVVYEK